MAQVLWLVLAGVGIVGFICLAIILLYWAILFFFQSHYVYRPLRGIESTPAESGLEYEDIRYRTEDGIAISAWYVPAKEARGVILFCHGNAGNLSHRLDFIEIFSRLGLGTFIFDYRGYGNSQGKPTEKGTYLDAEGAWRYLVNEKKVKPGEIIILGRSLGGAVASRLAKKHTPGLLIMVSAFTSIIDMARHLLKFFPARLLSRYQYRTEEHIREVKCPVFIIHSPEDEVVPFAHGQRLFEAAPLPRKFFRISGAHNWGVVCSEELYRRVLDEYFENP